MAGNNSFPTYALVMLLAGLGIPIMAALNGNLGTRLQNPALASAILFIVAGALCIIYLILSGNIPRSVPRNIPSYLLLGGVFVVFYILSITWIVPKFGIGNAVSFVLLGQLISMAAIDHFALLGAPSNPITSARFVGLLLMAVGAFLAVRRT